MSSPPLDQGSARDIEPPVEATIAPPVHGSDERPSAKPFPIVCIGASAGGLDAFSRLLGRLPAHPGMAFVLIQHLEPTHESQLRELLSRYSEMPVAEAVDRLDVQVDHVYVIPPNAMMTIVKGQLRIAPRGEARAPHLTIDHFMRSLAQDQQSRAIGVVLSGTGSDGTAGQGDIKAMGGITFAQDEASSKHPAMPGRAAQSGHVDFVLPPEEIAERLTRIGSHPYLSAPSSADQEVTEYRADLQRILGAIMAATGVDFAQYRDTTVTRRIMRRMALHGCDSLPSYAALLESDRSEVDALYRDLLINVTSFFRDPEMFEELKHRVFPELTRGRGESDTIRIWVAGCSTGQEAYSIAMALTEFFDDRAKRPNVQIFATDIGDPESLRKARAGVYPESIAAEVSPERLRRFFVKEEHGYSVGKAIRDLCVFARQDLATDPPFSHVDIISCRNVLIYMSPALQKRVLPTFHYALNVPGFLVLGSSETVGAFGDLFEPLDRTHKLFTKKPMASRSYDRRASDRVPGSAKSVRSGAVPLDFQREADRLLLHEYVPPGVLVNGTFDVLQFRGKTGPYLELPSGGPTASLLKMVREGLFLDLRSALNEVKNSQRPALRKGVRVLGDSGARKIDVRVLPVQPGETGEKGYLVLFEEVRPDASDGRPPVAAASPVHSSDEPSAGLRFWRRKPPAPDGSTPRRRIGDASPIPPEVEITQLRDELAATKEYLQSLIEQQDAANEQLRSANEETLSSNEELQSTNEELETAKEELQSTNEELITINEQLQNRNLEASLLSDDLTNLLTSTSIPAFMVGMDLRVRRATPAGRVVVNLLPTDVNWSIADVNTSLGVPDLAVRVSEVIESGRDWEQEIKDQTGFWWMLRIHPYRTTAHRIDGAVIHLQDIDKSKRTEVEITEAREYARAIVETVSEPLVVLSADLRIKNANRAFYETFALTPADAEGSSLFAIRNGALSDQSALKDMLAGVAAGHGTREAPAEVLLPRLGPRTLIFTARTIERVQDPTLILVSIHDVSEEKQALDETASAGRRKDEFLAMLAHELRNPLGSVVFALEILRTPDTDEEDREQAHGVLKRQVNQLVRMVDDLLDMSRITQGKLEIHKERVELGPIVRSAVETCRHVIETSGHHLSVHLPSRPVYLDADPIRLAQVMANLLHNACKFTPRGGAIEVSTELSGDSTQAGGAVMIRVRDNGDGIPAALLPGIYEMFAQGDRSLERARGGLGVGLTLVKSIILAHGGTVEARSGGPGSGTEFTVRLPRAQAPTPRSAAAGSGQGALTETHLRVLVVDDNVDFSDMVKLTLEGMGHEVRLAHDGQAALDAAADWNPDAIFLDIGLPRLNGYEVARRIREGERGCRVALVALTGWGQSEDKRLSMDAGFDFHLVKPADAPAFTKLLEEIQTARRIQP